MKWILTLLIMLALPCGASPLAVAKRVTPPGFGEVRQPQIAIDQNGVLYVAFGKGDAVYVSRSEGDDGSFSKPIKVAGLERLALGMRRGPRIATAGSAVVITAISHADGNLYRWRSDDRGRSWSKPSPVNTVAKSASSRLWAKAPHSRFSCRWPTRPLLHRRKKHRHRDSAPDASFSWRTIPRSPR